VLFSVVYKHINGTGEITLYLAQATRIYEKQHVIIFERILFMHGY